MPRRDFEVDATTIQGLTFMYTGCGSHGATNVVAPVVWCPVLIAFGVAPSVLVCANEGPRAKPVSWLLKLRHVCVSIYYCLHVSRETPSLCVKLRHRCCISGLRFGEEPRLHYMLNSNTAPITEYNRPLEGMATPIMHLNHTWRN